MNSSTQKMGLHFCHLISFIHSTKYEKNGNGWINCLQIFVKLFMKLFKLSLCVNVKIKIKLSDKINVFHRHPFELWDRFWLGLWLGCVESGNFMIIMYASPQSRVSLSEMLEAFVYLFFNPRAFMIEVISLFSNPGIRSDKCLRHLHL